MDRKSKMKYTGTEVWVNTRTGEKRAVDEFERPVGRGEQFAITYLAEIINMIDTLGNKKMQVVKYILKNMCKSNNILIATQREIAEATGLSTKTVNETIKLLSDSGIITCRVGSIMLSPHFCNNWRAGKEATMMVRYREFDNRQVDQIDGQFEITDTDMHTSEIEKGA